MPSKDFFAPSPKPQPDPEALCAIGFQIPPEVALEMRRRALRSKMTKQAWFTEALRDLVEAAMRNPEVVPWRLEPVNPAYKSDTLRVPCALRERLEELSLELERARGHRYPKNRLALYAIRRALGLKGR